MSRFKGGEGNIITERNQLKDFNTIMPLEPLDIKDIKTTNTLFMEQMAAAIVWGTISIK